MRFKRARILIVSMAIVIMLFYYCLQKKTNLKYPKNIKAYIQTLKFSRGLRSFESNTQKYMSQNILLDKTQSKLNSKEPGVFVVSNLLRKTWENNNLTELDELIEDFDEEEQPAPILKGDESQELTHLKNYVSYNNWTKKILLSDPLPDMRHTDCKNRLYLESLPNVSVVVPFFNERWSALLKTVYSLLRRSPENLIKEILLVDDASTKDFLKSRLDNYIKENFFKVKVIRLSMRSGLVSARLAGAKVATADVLVFLDSHTEVNVNWLPPLLEPVAIDHRKVTVPIIDPIVLATYKYIQKRKPARGLFDWHFGYVRAPIFPQDKENLPKPFESPVMMGGMFAISRRFFWELGGYDPGLFIWGGEQFEISFKIWQCGGRILEVPCSRVGHVTWLNDYPFNLHGDGNYLARNFRRVAEVWMDEYIENLYARQPHLRYIDPGDLTKQKAIRQKLKCKPFKWFMTQVAFDLIQRFPVVDPPLYAKGRIYTHKEPKQCIDAVFGKFQDSLLLTTCHSEVHTYALTWYNDVQLDSNNLCWDPGKSNPTSNTLVGLLHCHRGGKNQQWRYNEYTKHFVHFSGLSLDYKPGDQYLFLNSYDSTSETQMWDIDFVFSEVLAKWNVSNTLIDTKPVEKWN